jgi:CDP-6-deoxy-D-xylo-4-hexulose-3-dehydrase
MNAYPKDLKAEILRLTREYARRTHAAHRPGDDPARPAFDPSSQTVPYAARVFTEDEVEAAVSSTLDFWLTLGKEGEAFETELAAFLGVRHSLLVNSGSSANLIALSALTTHKLPPAKRLLPGDEVITAAAGFPTTVSPIIQCGAVPVFIDNDPATGNVRADQLEAAYSAGRTKAVIIAHTLGNPFDLGAVLEFCRRHSLWLIEDNCDALGSVYAMPLARAKALGLSHLLDRAGKNAAAGLTDRLPAIADGCLLAYTGTWGDLSTQSFYPPHHLTTGEGGAVNIVSHAPLKSYAESFRDWGRDCWCASGQDNTCGKRYGWRLGDLPAGYDHKYIYTHLGYNLKPLDPQAAIGRAQLRKLPAFIETRKRNWEYLRRELADCADWLDFALPTHATAWTPDGFEWDASGARSDSSWFGFMMRVKPDAPFTHSEFARHLDDNRVANRMLFGGNLVRQPVYTQLRRERPESFRVIGDLPGADALMRGAVFVGVYPGLTPAMLERIAAVVRDFCFSRQPAKTHAALSAHL